jgi:hypothetical protein
MAESHGAPFYPTMPSFHRMNLGFRLKLKLEGFEELAMIPFECS